MNENIDLTKILKNCPTGFELYSSVYGEVKFVGIDENHKHLWIDVKVKNNIYVSLTLEGKFSYNYDGECILFPSKDQRDWSKFTAPWLKKEKFNPKTLQPFDKVLVRIFKTAKWRCEHFSYFTEGYDQPYMASTAYPYCVPYNDDTKYLVGTTEEAPDFYRYWED